MPGPVEHSAIIIISHILPFEGSEKRIQSKDVKERSIRKNRRAYFSQVCTVEPLLSGLVGTSVNSSDNRESG